MGWFSKAPIEEEEDEIEPVQFKGALNGVDPNLKANQRLVDAGLVAAKDLVTDALDQRADTIRLEPKGAQAVYSFLIDGIAAPGGRMPKSEGMAVTQMLKLLAGLDIKERKAVQSGGIKAEFDGKKFQLMVQSAPVADGERLTIRCNDQAIKLNTPADLGMGDAMKAKIREIGTGTGVLLTCGPSGSGTTTTMFATLRGIDPYLYTVYTFGDIGGRPLEKDNVAKFEAKEGDDLGTTLDRLARAEANAVYIDPVNTPELAKTVFSKGEKILVLAETPAKDVYSAVTQLIEWTGDAKLVSEQLKGVISQKLMRALCPKCKLAYKPKADFLRKAGLPETVATLYRKPPVPDSEEEDPDYEACEKCSETGYFGRIAIFEFLVVSDEMKAMIAAKAEPNELKAQMRKEKMITLQTDALRLVAEGKTSLEEVQRVFKAT